jgi:predicted nucleotidyltransferase
MDYDRKKLQALIKKHHIALLLLFGSRATGRYSPDSDLDLGVLFNSDAYDQVAVRSDLLRVFPGYDIDLVVLNHSDAVLNFEIISNYQLLYSVNQERFINFYVNTVKQYHDIQKFLRQEDLYLKNYVGGAKTGVPKSHPPQIDQSGRIY